MAVPNVYSSGTKDREQVLRGLAVFASLFGAGLNLATFALYTETGDRGPVYPIGLTLATVVALAFTTLVWLAPRWTTHHSLLALVAGGLWVLLGFYTLDALGAVQVILGGQLVGVGVAGLAVPRWNTADARTPAGASRGR